MSVSIISCPGCKALLLSDTAQCPTCHHVLHPDKTTDIKDVRLSADGNESADTVECQDCGEQVRKELVRCWQCGAFLRREIADKYHKMQQEPSAITYSQLPDGDTFMPQARYEQQEAESTPTDDDDDGDFELAPGIETTDAVEPETIPLRQAPAPKPQTVAAATPAPAAPTTAPASKVEAKPEAVPAAAESKPSSPDSKDDAKPTKADSTKLAATSEEAVEAHSVATGGDALLDIAIQEEKELEKKRHGRSKKRSVEGRTIRVAKTGFIIFCPNGHQVEVQERHRGMTGQCPKCKAPFSVPEVTWDAKKAADEKKAINAQTKAKKERVDRFDVWLKDLRIHRVDPTKLKLKAGSLESAFDEFDFGFGKDELLIASLAKKGGSLFGGGFDEKKEQARTDLFEYLADDKPIEDVPALEHHVFDSDAIKATVVVQPAAYAHESMFAGIPVFGEGRIAIRLPPQEDSGELLYASFALLQFREFAAILKQRFDIDELGHECGIPHQDQTTELTCHYSENKLQSLENLEFYQADPECDLKLIGRRCQECGLVVSEDSRKKEKIGGLNGKAIAKSKCPKCKKKFGDISLYALEEKSQATVDPRQESSTA